MSDRDTSTPTRQVFGDVEKGTECRVCGRAVEDNRAKYCHDYCRNLAKAVMSLLNWGGVRRRVLERDDYTCQACGFDTSWLDKGDEHIRAIVESKLPERPEYPRLVDVGEGEVSDGEMQQYFDEQAAWQDRRAELIERYGDYRKRHVSLEVDHITPISEGGHPFDPVNLRTLCVDCHAEKTAAEAADRAERRTPSRGDLSASLFEYVADGGGEPDA